jgi:hypothetical protein
MSPIKVAQIGDVAHVAPALQDALKERAEVRLIRLRQRAATRTGVVKILAAPMRLIDAVVVARRSRPHRPCPLAPERHDRPHASDAMDPPRPRIRGAVQRFRRSDAGSGDEPSRPADSDPVGTEMTTVNIDCGSIAPRLGDVCARGKSKELSELRKPHNS